jgi:hypothetical protein
MNISKKQKGLTIEKLRKIRGFEKLPSKEVEDILYTLREYSRILFSVCKSLKRNKQISSMN